MPPNILKAAQRIMDKWGEDCTIDGIGAVRAIVKKNMMDMDNKDVVSDSQNFVTFLKPTPQSNMRNLVLTDADGIVYELGKTVGTNGYLVEYEATPQ